MKKSLVISILVFFLGCQEEPVEKIFVKDNCSNYIGEWKNARKNEFYGSTLKIKQDSSFNYSSQGCTSESFSEGKWFIENDEIILNSIKEKDCYYLYEFGVNCEILKEDYKSVSIRTTIENCDPMISSISYTLFVSERFKLVNDTLKYINSKGGMCPELNENFVKDIIK